LNSFATQLLVASLWMWVSTSYSQDSISYRSKSIEYKHHSKDFELIGAVEINSSEASIKSDTISYNIDDGTLIAKGKPIMEDSAGNIIRGKLMRYNLKRKVGRILYGSSRRDGILFNGMDIRRVEDGRLLVARGDFSPCTEDDDQGTYFYSRRLLVKPSEYALAQPVVLNVQDIPVMALPLLVYPLGSGRKSGLLVPRFGGDQAQGFYLRNLGVYWAINDYMDWDAKADFIEGSRGTFDQSNTSSKFRYNKRYWLDGNIEAKSYLEQFSLDNAGWSIQFQHNQNLVPDQSSNIRGQGKFVSNRTVERNQALDRQAILSQQANAQLGWRHQFNDRSIMNTQIKQTQNLNQNDSTSTYKTERVLPNIQYSRGGNPLEIFGLGRGDTWLDKFQYSYNIQGERFTRIIEDTLSQKNDTTWTGFKDNLNISWQEQLFGILNISPNMNHTGYLSKDTADGYSTNQLEIPSTYYHHYNLGVNTDTKLYGFWRPHWGRFTGIRHVITPKIGWTWSPEFDSIPGLFQNPHIGGQPYQQARQSIKLGLGNDFDLKYINSYQTTADSGLTPQYKTLRWLNTSTNTSYNFSADSLHWNDLNSNISLAATQRERLSISMTHSLYNKFLPNSKERLIVRDPLLMSWNFSLSRRFNWNGDIHSGDSGQVWTPWSASTNFTASFRSNRVNLDAFKNTFQYSSNANLNLEPIPGWKLNYATTYDFKGGKFAEHRLRFDNNLGCWKMQFAWTPSGPAQGWNFQVFMTDLPDIEFKTSDNKLIR
jgi:hypothetical protein